MRCQGGSGKSIEIESEAQLYPFKAERAVCIADRTNPASCPLQI